MGGNVCLLRMREFITVLCGRALSHLSAGLQYIKQALNARGRARSRKLSQLMEIYGGIVAHSSRRPRNVLITRRPIKTAAVIYGLRFNFSIDSLAHEKPHLFFAVFTTNLQHFYRRNITQINVFLVNWNYSR